MAKDNNKTTILNNGLLWFGAAVSIAEILAGTLFAPLGFINALLAILTGHIIGCTLLYFAGLIGAKRNVSSMESVRISFGQRGSILFSGLNILQLVGWTAVMIVGGAKAIGVIADDALGLGNDIVWCILIAVLIILWIAVGIKNLGKLNLFAVGALFVLTVVLSTVVFKGTAIVSAANQGTGLSFGAAVELSAAMPLSWLPLISDYTRHAKNPKAATLASTASYFVGSCWMYAIGLGAALFTADSDIGRIMMRAGMGIAGVLILLLATVTTTFMDAYSAGVSFTNITKKIDAKWIGIVVCIAGMLIAMFTPIEQYVDFLYLIGSVFAPMIAILITDYFILKKDHDGQKWNISNLILWAVGFAIYRVFLSIDIPIGCTLPVMIIIGILCILINGGKKICLKKR